MRDLLARLQSLPRPIPPLAERLRREVLSIPLHPALTDAEVESVVKALNAF